MALVPAICTQCGAQIEVDNTHEAGICKFCGTPFITEKAINKYTTVHNVTQNITKIIYGNEKDEASDYFNRGVTQLKIENWVEAYKAFNKACKTAPQVAKYWLYSAVAQTQNLTSLDEICLDEDRDVYCGSTRIAAEIKSFSKLANDDDFALANDEFGLSLCSDFKRSFVSFVARVLTNDNYDNDIYATNIFVGNAGTDAKYQNFVNDLSDELIKEKIDGKKAFAILDAFGSNLSGEQRKAFEAICIPTPDKRGNIEVTKYNIGALTKFEDIVVKRSDQQYETVIRVLDMQKIDLAKVKRIDLNKGKEQLVDKVVYCDAKDGRHIELRGMISILDASAVGNKLKDYKFDSLRLGDYPIIIMSGKFSEYEPIRFGFNVPPETIICLKDGGKINASSPSTMRLGYLSDGVLHDVKPAGSDNSERDGIYFKFEGNAEHYFTQAMKEGKVKRPATSKLKSFFKKLTL